MMEGVIGGVTRTTMIIGTLVALTAGLTGCANMEEPLRAKHLHDEAKDPRVVIVLMHFKSQQIPPVPKGFTESISRGGLSWIFAVANESTGWSFRKLDETSMILRTDETSLDPDFQSYESGWVTFLAPPGLNYIAATTGAVAFGRSSGESFVAKPFPDHISVERSKTQHREMIGGMMDFIDEPRFAVHVPESRSLIYAGTLARTIQCEKDMGPSSTCPYDLNVVDESELATKFIGRYLRDFTATLPMQTRLFTIPQSRTIEIRSGSAIQH